MSHSELSELSGSRIGIVLPSSNTVVEPLAAEMLAGTGITAHFSRLGVYDVALDPVSKAQFELQAHVDAARLLADAKVDVIVWGGTSASWLGSIHDQTFCDSVVAQTGIPTTSCVLQMNRLLRDSANHRLGLVTPYTEDVHKQIIENYKLMGYECTGSENVGGAISNDFANIPEDLLAKMVHKAGLSKPDLIFIMCTNLHGAVIAHSLTTELRIPVIDSAAASIEAGLSLLQQHCIS